MNEVNEKDWKLFRKYVPIWQERYILKLNKEYIEILSKDGSSACNFWELEKRIRIDKKHPGVIMEMRRSTMYWNLLNLLNDNVISIEELNEFSSELVESLKRSLKIEKGE